MTKKETKKRRLRNKYRFSIFNDTTHEQLFSFRGNGWLSILSIALLVVFIIVSVTLLISYTSLREFIPGYPSAETRHTIARNAIKIDSLNNEINLWRLQLTNIQRIVTGGEPMQLDSILSLQKYADSTLARKELLAKNDSILRDAVIKNEQFNINGTPANRIERIEGLHFFQPVKGIVTQEFNSGAGHPYIDIAAPENSVVSAVLDGTVIADYYNDETGYVIQIQHNHDIVSIYKHNAKLIKKTGDKVSAGTPISLVGSTGRLSTAPHLHFELWYKGEPIDAAEYIKF